MYIYVCANIFSALGTAFVHVTLSNIHFIIEMMYKKSIICEDTSSDLSLSQYMIYI